MAQPSGAISNYTSFLQSQGRDQPAHPAAPPADPRLRLLGALHRQPLLPLAEVAKETGLHADDALPLVEKLRSMQEVEVVRVGDDGARFLRLTPLGFNAT